MFQTLSVNFIVESQTIKLFRIIVSLFHPVAVLQILSTAKVIIGRSMVSKLVPNDELGKIYAVLGSVEALVPILGMLIYNNIYRASLNFFPGIIFLVTAVLMCFVLIAYV
jgi:PCFT/HCP family folate transporter-like MFS transporter 1/3